MKKFLFTLLSSLFLMVTFANASNNQIIQAYKKHKSDVQVKGSGKVIKILRDDTKGSKHQRFILRISKKVTVLVAHNIDLAPRAPVREGDRIKIKGRYEWNNRGGVLHWTHHDPKGRKESGWIYAGGQYYK